MDFGKCNSFFQKRQNNFSSSWQSFWEKPQELEKRRSFVRYHALTVELIQTAAQKARSLGHSYVGSEHLLLAISNYISFSYN